MLATIAETRCSGYNRRMFLVLCRGLLMARAAAKSYNFVHARITRS
ncbi:MAG: hypothetical protein ACJZ66_01185 [Parvibaculales bacterium]